MTQTPQLTASGRVDFHQNSFDTLVAQKGRDVIYEKAVMCPCKSKSTNALPSCKNCGGSGWLFINPIVDRMVVQKLDISTEFKPWSEESRGTIAITALQRHRLSFMDRITLPQAESVFNEILHLNKVDNDVFSFATYEIKHIEYIAKFTDVHTALTRLTPDQYTIDGSILRIPSLNKGDSVSIRYIHSPVYHIVELQRESIESYRLETGSEKQQRLPISALARRAHYIINRENFTGDRIIDNSFDDAACI